MMKGKIAVDRSENTAVAHRKPLDGFWASSHSIWAVALNEWRLQWRSLTFWILLFLNSILMILEIQLVAPMHSYWNGDNFAVSMSTGGLTYILLTIPFLVMNVFARDQKRGMHSILWVRPLSALEYVLGKGLAVAIISSVICVFSLFSAWAMASWLIGILQPWQTWLEIGGILLISVISMVWLALLLIRLLGPLPGTLLCAVIPIYLLFNGNYSLLNLVNLTLIDIFYTQSSAFGPDTALLIAQRIFYLILAALFLVVLVLFFRLREPRSLLPRRQLIITSCIIALLIVALLGTFVNFSLTTQKYQDISIAPNKLSSAQFSHYSLNATIDPERGSIDGTVHFRLAPATGSGNVFYVALPPSLQVQYIAVADQISEQLFTHAISYTSSTGWTKLDLASTSYARGQAIWIVLHYSGVYGVSRDNYSDAQSGTLIGLSDQNTLTNYIGNGTSFLSGDGAGSWYPLPWTQQVSLYGNRLPIDEVQLTFPASATVVSSLVSPQRTADGKWQTITIHPQGILPLAFVGAMTRSEQMRVDQMPVFYAGSYPDATRMRTYAVAISQTLTLEAWLHADSQASTHWHAMVMPFLNHPIVGSGLLLLPESPAYSMTHLDLNNQTILTRFVGGQVASSWWLNAIRGNASVFQVHPSQQRPQGTIRFVPGSETTNALAHYTASVATGRILGHPFFDQEQLVCSDSNSNGTLALARLGIEECESQTMVFYQLRAHDGEQKVTSLLQAFARNDAQQAATWPQFITFASVILHRDVTAELIPYICATSKSGVIRASSAAGKGKQAGNCLDTPQGGA